MENLAVIESLKNSGHRVWIKHNRDYDIFINVDLEFKATVNHRISNTGGETVVEITTPQGVTVAGTSRCSKKDHFNKKMGVRIALGRAMSRLS